MAHAHLVGYTKDGSPLFQMDTDAKDGETIMLMISGKCIIGEKIDNTKLSASHSDIPALCAYEGAQVELFKEDVLHENG